MGLGCFGDADEGLGFRVWGLGFGVWGLGFRVQGLGFGFGFRVTPPEVSGKIVEADLNLTGAC